MREKIDTAFGFAELPEPDPLTRDATIEKRRCDGSVKIGVTFALAIVCRQTAGKAAFSADNRCTPAAVPANLSRIGDQLSAQRAAIRVNDSPRAIRFPPLLFHNLTTGSVMSGTYCCLHYNREKSRMQETKKKTYEKYISHKILVSYGLKEKIPRIDVYGIFYVSQTAVSFQ